jgi:hypothetical protein
LFDSYEFIYVYSPSGCTFWGKKQWSRKKVILWQVATLIGAPVIIGLIAGVAVPGVVIGVPIWAGRRIFKKYNKNENSKTKRNVLVTLSVVGSIITSPIIATLAVGIGVPILLAYVYGVRIFDSERKGKKMSSHFRLFQFHYVVLVVVVLAHEMIY